MVNTFKRFYFDSGVSGTAVCLTVPLGSADESPDCAGVAHLVEHVICRQIEGVLQQMDIDEFFVSARTMPLHTEFTIWFTNNLLLVNEKIDSIIYSIRNIQSIDLGLITREINVILREIDLRIGRSINNVLPWSYSPAIYKGHRACHNAFFVDYSDVEQVRCKVDEWVKCFAVLPFAIGVLSSMRCTNINTDTSGFVDYEMISRIIPGYVTQNGIDDTLELGTVTHPIQGLRDTWELAIYGSKCSIARMNRKLDYFYNYLARVVSAATLNHRVRESFVYVGLFGPWSAPDDGTILVYSKSPYELVLPSIKEEDVDIAINELCMSIRRVSSSPMEHAAFLSRSALFGWPLPERIMSALQKIKIDMVQHMVSHFITKVPARHLFVVKKEV